MNTSMRSITKGLAVAAGALSLALGAQPGASAQAGQTDPTFGQGGVTAFDSAAVFDLVVQQDGKTVTLGRTVDPVNGDDEFVVSRFLRNGAPDRTFGTSGRTVTDFGGFDDFPEGLTVDSDGRIVVTGYSWRPDGVVLVARYTPAGRLDRTFSADGKVVTDVSPRYDDTGSAVSVAPSGKIVVAGDVNLTNAPSQFPLELNDDLLMVRYQPNGSLDKSLQGRGWATVDLNGGRDDVHDASLVDGGTLLVAAGTTVGYDETTGWSKINGSVTAVKPDGTVARGFATGGTAWTAHTIRAMAVQRNGKIVVSGTKSTVVDYEEINDAAVSRFLPDGRPDLVFGTGGGATLSFNDQPYTSDVAADVAVDSKSRVYLVGETDKSGVHLARLSPRGALDRTFGVGGFSSTSVSTTSYSDSGHAIALQGGLPVVAGTVGDRSFLVRYLTA